MWCPKINPRAMKYAYNILYAHDAHKKNAFQRKRSKIPKTAASTYNAQKYYTYPEMLQSPMMPKIRHFW